MRHFNEFARSNLVQRDFGDSPLVARILVHHIWPKGSMVTLSSIRWPSLPASRISMVPPFSDLFDVVERKRQRRQLVLMSAVVTK